MVLLHRNLRGPFHLHVEERHHSLPAISTDENNSEAGQTRCDCYRGTYYFGCHNSELNTTDKELETVFFMSEEKESETKLYIKTLEESLAKLRQEIATLHAEN